MDKLGYIKNISLVVKKLGGKLTNFIPLKNSIVPLNPTVCYVIDPPKVLDKKKTNKIQFTTPGTNFSLKRDNGFFVCKQTGLVYPIFKDIPILKNGSSIIATANF